ncbi:hypothetical protein HZA38_05325 [Candidatus Peregrinibacteria bacterium]|nr:hypothetical protein [Candidatus Peregrinibacteria bacterium]
MNKPFSYGVLLFPLLLLSACGGIDLPSEEKKGDTTLISEAPSGTSPETENKAEGDKTTSLKANEDGATGILQCLTEKERISEALDINTKELEKCLEDKKGVSRRIEALTSRETETEKFQKFVKYYLENTKPSEYPFPKCGQPQLFKGESWYVDFEAALHNAAIPFGRETISVENLTGGCYSSDGKMAFFLGAQDGQGTYDFHLLKYNLEGKTLEEAFLVDGKCDICPTKLGKRNGPFLSLQGQEGANQVEYEYYYADNILQKK